MMFIVMKSGIIHPTQVKDEAQLHALLNDGWPFLLLKNRWSINKYEISHTFTAGENPLLEKISTHPVREQELLRGIIRLKKANGYPVKTYDGLMLAYKRMITDKSVDKYWNLPVSVDSWLDLSLTYTPDDTNETE